MKGIPAVPGGRLTSKPTWSNRSGCSTTSAFFRLRQHGAVASRRDEPMDESKATMAEQIARAASAFERQRTGHAPKSVTVVLSADTLVITLRGALSPAEKAVAQSPTGAAQMQKFHRQLFDNSCQVLRQEINRIIGVEVREATAEVETTTGTVVQVFLLDRSVPGETWSGSGPGNPS